jgi:hypothetical protein
LYLAEQLTIGPHRCISHSSGVRTLDLQLVFLRQI